MKRKDERDIMFSRMIYRRGTTQYEDYYSRHPEKKQIDDELRSRSELFSSETPTFDKILSPAADANFDFLTDIRHLSEGVPVGEKTIVEASEVSHILKNLTLHYGAKDASIVHIDEQSYYSHRGRLLDNYGDSVDTSLRTALIFTVAMAYGPLNTAPAVSQSVETSRAYIEAAVISLQISYLIRNLGYNARCHMDANYLMPLVPLAVKAGLGVIGRNGLLISRTNGCFVRLGAITIDMPLEADSRDKLDIARFCKICRRCIITCPGQTVSDSQNPEEWRIDQEKCYGRWRHLGTDCGICISTCPIGQDITVDEITKMNNKEIKKFIGDYNDEYGSRKRTVRSYFE